MVKKIIMENKLKAPDGYTFKVISDTEIELQPIQKKYPTNIKEIKRNYYVETTNDFKPVFSLFTSEHHSSRETALKFAAMMQLIEFRDAWNKIDGFVADWENSGQTKWVISICGKKPIVSPAHAIIETLHFGSKETAERFLKQFEQLIIQAGDLV